MKASRLYILYLEDSPISPIQVTVTVLPQFQFMYYTASSYL